MRRGRGGGIYLPAGEKMTYLRTLDALRRVKSKIIRFSAIACRWTGARPPPHPEYQVRGRARVVQPPRSRTLRLYDPFQGNDIDRETKRRRRRAADSEEDDGEDEIIRICTSTSTHCTAYYTCTCTYFHAPSCSHCTLHIVGITLRIRARSPYLLHAFRYVKRE